MLRIDHIVFPVWDVPASLAFYTGVMGFKLVASHTGSDWGGHPWLMMVFDVGDGRELVLVHLKGSKVPSPDGLARDVRHFAFAVESIAALDGWRDRLAAADVDYWEEDHGDQQSVYFEDPNGVVLEITAPPSQPGQQSHDALDVVHRWIAPEGGEAPAG